MTLYTGKGDGGTTKTFGCDQQRISKASELPEALGSLDELNSFLGLAKLKAKSCLENNVPGIDLSLPDVLHEVQEALFIVQAETAGADKRVGQERVVWLETITNAIEKEITPLKGFSIAGGTECSAVLDIARTMARRAERRLIGVADNGLREIAPETKAYMNRLSSLLFALARLSNHNECVMEQNPKY